MAVTSVPVCTSMLKRAERVPRGHEQGAFVRDDVPHIVRQPAVRKRHVGAPLEHDDLDGLVEPP
jgi:hypothetical protein